ncbi:conserved hypothetical protein [Sulfolobus islandicus Y.G.57.14]|jgi:predicted nucleic acid-binding protein|uniref:PIN domain-containing protein n=10 Tax=Saccharolobus islandicus TaxID=43080 RepID=C3MPA3_SACI2|nr:PIN domain-containing protein [Sulfolobus islandicus]ACP35216.1 conserved hypothetical protein [Sulfolobus islandicus L.S.2.15]ACP37870.1 conserved hypothetical protein [Sulfolobus islandicus M.14.25]ACP45371.1 conserved hypothetical protein [Sulfolobus islandicus Y.G.57.14]ACP48828.1 conserved hypothetical protein [Sulfolobus islandicus Y.N.15.51]ACP55060.1 conserved hypothetical protein [Sulfolobus islandicus M.16.27]
MLILLYPKLINPACLYIFNMFAVISPSAFGKLKEILGSNKNYKFVITTLGVSFAIKNGIDIDNALDHGVIVRAFSHKPPKVGDLPQYESEAIMVALELNALLIAEDKDVIGKAKELGVNAVQIEELLTSS